MKLIPGESPLELSKVLGEWALAAGRYLQSAQTGFVHYYYNEGQTVTGYQTIPLVENALFALALLRSRLVDHVQEAKAIIKRLLPFQNQQAGESQGNFPVYLHDYPACQNPALALQLLASFYWMIKQFGHVLGADLKQKLEEAARQGLEHSLRVDRTKAFPYSLAIRLAAAQCSFGTLWKRAEWQQEGQQRLDLLSERQLEGWQATAHLGDCLVGLQMVYPSLLNSPWFKLWHYMEQTWYCQTGCYIGPCIKEWQEGEEPQANLYDLYAGYFSGQFARRATLLRAYHLQAALIQPSSDKFTKISQPFIKEGQLFHNLWHTMSHSDWAYTLFAKRDKLNLSLDKTYTPFRLIWGDLHAVHSLVCQGGRYEKVDYLIEGHALKIFFYLSAEVPVDDRDQCREVEFFVDFHSDVRLTLEGQATTTFELNQKVLVSFGKHQLSLVFHLLEGEGQFLGHLMRSNRPSQMSHKGEKRFQSYDWTFFLRTVRRQGPCCLTVTIDMPCGLT